MKPQANNSRPLCLVVGSLETNCYLVPTSDGLLIIDPGDQAAEIARACQDLPVPAGILLTHGHPDHAGAAARLAEMLRVPVLAHEGDREWLEGRRSIWGAGTPAVVFEAVSEGLCRLDSVMVLCTPGHTPGSVCFGVGNLWFVGDTLFRSSVGRTDLPGGDYEALLGSLRRLAEELPPEAVLLPGHGPQTTLAQEIASNPWMQEALGD